MRSMNTCLALALVGSRHFCGARNYAVNMAFRSTASRHSICSRSHHTSWSPSRLHSTSTQDSSISSIQRRMNDLVSHPGVVWDKSTTFSSMHTKKLRQRHLQLFNRTDDGTGTTDHVFDQFAQAVCNAGVTARKEVFETWASALHIYSSFLRDDGSDEMKTINRVADIASGHGLLSWALLILDDEHQKSKEQVADGNLPLPLTVFCLDVKMPRSAERIQSAMIQQWPHLEDRFDYVEGRLEQLIPHTSCLLVSVHACGFLSDVLVSTSAKHGVPLALVPCCHSRNKKVLEVASPFAMNLYQDIIGTKGGIPDLADRLDGARMTALKNSGLTVKEAFLPDLFTGKNRLIMSFPTSAQTNKNQNEICDNKTELETKEQPMRKGQMPPLDNPTSSIIPKARFLKGFVVPCEDSTQNRKTVSELAGRMAANKRKAVMHNRNHAKSPQMDLSLWLPEDDVGLNEDALAAMIESKHKVKCSVSKLGELYVNPAGRRSQAFRFRYNNPDDEATMFPFDDAWQMHQELYKKVPIDFPGAECR